MVGLLTRIAGLKTPPIPGMENIGHDWVDDVFAQYGADVLTRIDPRDVTLTSDNPTGIGRVHWAGPNRDPITYTGSGTRVGTVAGKYNGKRVFDLSVGANAATYNTLSVGPRSLNGVTEFTMFGVMDFDASILGSGFHALVTMVRDKLNLESLIAHQFGGGADYITAWADQGDGGGANLLYSGGPVVAGTPFAFAFRVKGTSTANSRVDLFVNQVATPATTQAGIGTPETGSMEIRVGNAINTAHQTPMRFARGYVIAGDALDTVDKANIALEAMISLRTFYGVP